MNRFKKEEARKHQEARVGLTELETKQLDHDEAIEEEINQLARSIHSDQFSEEYDVMFDSIADANERKRGINPMSDSYIKKVAVKREEQGVSPLLDSGEPMSRDTWEIAYAEAEARVRGQKTQ